MLNKKMRVFL